MIFPCACTLVSIALIVALALALAAAAAHTSPLPQLIALPPTPLLASCKPCPPTALFVLETNQWCDLPGHQVCEDALSHDPRSGLAVILQFGISCYILQ